MAVVNTCPYCHRSMSSDLIWCPHCEKIYPRLVTCYICYQAVSTTEAIVKRKRTTAEAYYHPSCYREVLKEQTCPTCSYTFSEQEQNNFGGGDEYLDYTNCPNCGHRWIKFFYCPCEMKGIAGKDAQVRYLDGSVAYGNVHRTCVTARQLSAEREWKESGEKRAQLLAHRKKSRLCLICGKKISWLEKLLNGGKCNWDASEE
jgi:hypothetical protein